MPYSGSSGAIPNPLPVSQGSTPWVIGDGGVPLLVTGALAVTQGTNPWIIGDGGASLTIDSAQLPAALVGGRLDANIGAWLGSTAPTVGQKAMAASLPVAISSDQTSLPVVVRESSMTWVSARNAAPAIGAVQADTGALAAGTYDFDVNLVVSDTVAVGKGLVIEHRNAANAATLFNLGGASPNGGSISIKIRSYVIAANERVRVIAGTAAGAAGSNYLSAIGYRLSA